MIVVNLYEQMSEILDEIKEDVHDCAERAADKAGKETVNKVKALSPSKSGEYKRGWTRKKLKATSDYGATVIVYNKTMPGLTHLLNNGHVLRNKYGEFGRVSGDGHIGTAASYGTIVFVEEMNKELDKKLGG